jgi:chemotaxis signal transduction protein
VIVARGPTHAVTEMREAFDRSFSEPAALQGAPGERILLVRVAGHAYAMRMTEVSAVVADRKLVTVPSPVLDLLGLAGIRGSLVAVYGLSSLLGHGPSTGGGRWIAVCQAGEPVGLSFGELDGQLSVRADRILLAGAPGDSGDGQHIRYLVETDDGVRPLIAVPALLEAIRQRCDRARAAKER